MNRSFLIFLFLFNCFFAKAQTNLVPNPSFEDIDSCLGTYSNPGFDVFGWSGCTGWRTPTYGSSDLWCPNGLLGNIMPPNILGLGFQYPKSGSNMAGLFIAQGTYHEYIQCTLTQPMIAGKSYQMTFYVNDSGVDSAYPAYTSSIGAYFSQTPVGNPTSYYQLPYQPQILNPTNNFITDTAGWSPISGTYQAIGGERYITIGNFADSSQLITTDSIVDTFYFYVDDVSLSEVLDSIPNVFSPNGDGINDVFFMPGLNAGDRVCFYNRWGTKVYEFAGPNDAWDGRTTTGEKCSDGVYYYFIASEKFGIKKGFIQLLR